MWFFISFWQHPRGAGNAKLDCHLGAMPPQAVLDSKPRPAFARERATAEKPSHAFVGNNHTQLEYHPILDSEQVQASTEEHSECCCRILMCSGCVPVCLCPVLGCVVVVEYSATPRFNISTHVVLEYPLCSMCLLCVSPTTGSEPLLYTCNYPRHWR